MRQRLHIARQSSRIHKNEGLAALLRRALIPPRLLPLPPLEESRQPFIFMNAAGVQRDVETLLHEGGHAFHHLASAAAEPLVFLRSAPMEFCEVASMSMEALGCEHYEVFYDDPADAARAKR